MKTSARSAAVLSTILFVLANGRATVAAPPATAHRGNIGESLRQAIDHLCDRYGQQYANGPKYLEQLQQLEQQRANGEEVTASLRDLQRTALLDHPLMRELQIVLVRRKPKDLRDPKLRTERDRSINYAGAPGREIGLPSNHECNASLERWAYENDLAILHPDGTLSTLYRPDDGGYVGEIDLHWDAERLLLTESDAMHWKISEIHPDGSGYRQVSQMPDDVDCMDPCYLPSGKIIFGSTASYQSVPCWHGQKWVSNLYVMDSDGSGVRQLCFDQDHDFHPCVLPNGQVLYHRWDYTGISHVYLRPLMVMNPDGTGQRAAYGSNSWFPNSLYFPRPVPNRSGELVAILSGYHGVHRMGQLVRLDLDRGWQEAEGLVQRISGEGQPITPKIRDALVDQDWPKFLHPYPISSHFFLVSCWRHAKGSWGIYLADVFDNLVLVHEQPGWALLEPTPLRPRPVPPVIPDRVNLQDDQATVYLHDVYMGPGLEGVPRGTIKSLRVLAYHFAYRGLAGSDKIGFGGPWDAMQIIGTVPLEPDGSAHFQVPANTPLAVQPLDEEGKAVQLMRSWFTAMPGEQLSCVGCHETPANTPQTRLGRAAQKAPRAITPWFGPPRGFDFAREVQPVLNQHCVSCHHGDDAPKPDLRPEEEVENPPVVSIGYADRMHPQMREETGGKLPYTPAYLGLIHYIRRPNIEDDVSLLTPGEYHADTSELVQLLRNGHYGVALDAEAWDRLVTWIDLNGPCHGTWQDVYSIPDTAVDRRSELQHRFGGPKRDPEKVTPIHHRTRSVSRSDAPSIDVARPTRRAETSAAPTEDLPRKSIDLGENVTIELVRISPGELPHLERSESTHPADESRVIRQPFWIGVFEVTNEQFRRFDPQHHSGYYAKRHAHADDRGLPMNDPQQPVVRVSFDQAERFCRWLAQRTGMDVRLPSELEWEYACRAGTTTPLFYGTTDDDFSQWANLADAGFGKGLMTIKAGRVYPEGVTQVTGGVPHLLLEGAQLSDTRYRDGAVVTTTVGSYQPNRWGLHDMHGNATEWTQTLGNLAIDRDSTRQAVLRSARRIVRGGSFFDRPARSTSGFRLDYPAWQRLFHVGFRVAATANEETGSESRGG